MMKVTKLCILTKSKWINHLISLLSPWYTIFTTTLQKTNRYHILCEISSHTHTRWNFFALDESFHRLMPIEIECGYSHQQNQQLAIDLPSAEMISLIIIYWVFVANILFYESIRCTWQKKRKTKFNVLETKISKYSPNSLRLFHFHYKLNVNTEKKKNIWKLFDWIIC